MMILVLPSWGRRHFALPVRVHEYHSIDGDREMFGGRYFCETFAARIVSGEIEKKKDINSEKTMTD